MAGIDDSFQPGLRDLASAVWTDLERNPCTVTSDAIYAHYSHTAPAGDVRWEDLEAFLVGLSDMPIKLDDNEPGSLITGVQDEYMPGTETWYTLGPYLKFLRENPTGRHRRDAWDNFYHFNHRSDADVREATKRVYVRLSSVSLFGVAVLLPILKAVAASPQHLYGAKIVGPGGQSRRDHIVVYATSVMGWSMVFDHLKTLDPAMFEADLPLSVKELRPGIGIADEPPPATEESHGSLMTEIIWGIASAYRAQMCQSLTARDRDEILAAGRAYRLEEIIRDGTQPTREIFLTDVEKEFRRWGVNPRFPHQTQGAVRPRPRQDPIKAGNSETALHAALRAATAPRGIKAASIPARGDDRWPVTGRSSRDPRWQRRLLKLYHPSDRVETPATPPCDET
jgi:hypothetical protein